MSSATPATPDLTSCIAKLEWAETNFESLNSDIGRWVAGEPKPYLLVPECSDDGVTHKLLVRVNRAPDINRWSLRWSDCVHNMRTALDHFAFSVVRFKAPTA